MKRLILIYILIISSCSPRTIPEDKLVSIYSEMYIVDLQVRNSVYRDMTDSLMIFEPIFQKYGYTTDDFKHTVDKHLEKPEELIDIFKQAQEVLNVRKAYLENILERENRVRKMMSTLEVDASKDSINNDYYRALNSLFFEADSLLLNSPVIDSTPIIMTPFELYEEYSVGYRFEPAEKKEKDTTTANTDTKKLNLAKSPGKKVELEKNKDELNQTNLSKEIK